MRKLIVLVDGSWCGSETNTRSNIFILAEMMGINMALYNPAQAQPIQYQDATRGINACYFPGAGLGGTFLEYIFNGATAHDIDRDCIDVYRYIVENYIPMHEIWMFGLSRGAYTVRCVAGMINNCGILKRMNEDGVLLGPILLERMYHRVYRIYRSDDPEDHPQTPRSTEFRTQASHNVPTPVKFMGLFDTVGSLGIPYLNPGLRRYIMPSPSMTDFGGSYPVTHYQPYNELENNLKSMSDGSLVVTTISAASGFDFCDTERTGLNASLVMSLLLSRTSLSQTKSLPTLY
ncbi:hypothetical protein BGW39_001727 [Mortierella sp. 14UC]|nr:hypothetical protein BGW39_001727 [Mortierella sp. 14UC]